MFRALSTRRSGRGYERLVDEPSNHLLEAKLNRSRSVPAKVLFGSCRKLAPQKKDPANPPAKQAKKVSKIHPLFSLFDTGRRKNKPTAKPEFARYMEYVEEGGLWDKGSNVPVIYYK
ncbi:hypothetical protein NMG60_11021248 [Bertholletia excelsa]